MGHKLLFVVALIFVKAQMFAQITVVLPVWSEFAMSPEQLLDGQILSVHGGEHVVAMVSVRDIMHGDLIISTRTQPFVLRKGTTQLKDFRTSLSTSYGGTQLAGYVRVHRRLPQGSFECCLLLLPAGGQEELVQECERLDSESMAILDLISPSHKDTIDECRPALTWIKSGDFVSGRGRMFRLTLVELLKGQAPETAIRENRPLLSGLPLEQMVFSFPASAANLIPGKTYAWAVDWIEQEIPKVTTEVWIFTVSEPRPDPLIKYVMLRRSGSAQTYEARGQRVYFTLEDPAADPSQLNLRLVDKKGKVISQTMNENLQALSSAGYNQFELNLRAFDLDEGIYLLNVVNIKGDRYQLYFEYER